jgi:hypothetical protein
MEYVIDLDPIHQVLRVTLTGTVTDSSVRELRASLSHFAAAHDPYAAIFDLSGVTGHQLSIETIRDFVKKRPAVPSVRLRVVVAPRPEDYRLSRVFEQDEMRGQFHLVLSVDEAYAMLRVNPENFSQRLFPEQLAA